MAREKFLRNAIFSMERIVVSNLESSAKMISHLTSTHLEIWVENSVFAIQNIENRKGFTEP